MFKIVSSLFDAFPAATECKTHSSYYNLYSYMHQTDTTSCSCRVLNESTHYVPTSTKGIQHRRKARRKPIPSLVHQAIEYCSLHAKHHPQNSLLPSKIFSYVTKIWYNQTPLYYMLYSSYIQRFSQSPTTHHYQ